MLGTVKCKTGKEDDGDRVWHPAPQPGWGSLVIDGAHRQCVIAGYSFAAAKDVCGGGTTGARNSSGLAQPSVQ